MSATTPLELTPEEEQELANFLVQLDYEYLSLDRSRKAIAGAFPYTERQAREILVHMSDRNILLWGTTSSGLLRWFFVNSIVEALLKIGWMTNRIEDQNRQSNRAVQTVVDCSDEEAERIRIYLSEMTNGVIQRVSDYVGPGVETNSRWIWKRVQS